MVGLSDGCESHLVTVGVRFKIRAMGHGPADT